MNLKKFLDLSSGKWFSQRTNYRLSDGDQVENSKADITIELIETDDSRAVQLCQKHHLDPQLSLGGTVQTWNNSVDWGKPKRQGSSGIFFVSNPDSERSGKLIRPEDPQICGRYLLGEDEALTLIIETEDMYAQERQWFASDNLRMRTTVVKYSNGLSQTSFYSEIRKASPKEQSTTDD